MAFLTDRRILVEAQNMGGEYLIDAVRQCEVINTNKIAASVLAQVNRRLPQKIFYPTFFRECTPPNSTCPTVLGERAEPTL